MFTPASSRRSSNTPFARVPLALRTTGFTSLGGELVPYGIGQAAIRNGRALLVGGLLVYGAMPG